MNKNCKYCDAEGMCSLENTVCMGLPNDVCTVDMRVLRKEKPNARDEYVVYFYNDHGAYVYCIKCWCNTINELLDLIDDENTDYTYEIRKVQE